MKNNNKIKSHISQQEKVEKTTLNKDFSRSKLNQDFKIWDQSDFKPKSSHILNIIIAFDTIDTKIIDLFLNYNFKFHRTYVSQQRLADLCKCSIRTIQRRLEKLKKLGLISSYVRGVKKTNFYRISNWFFEKNTIKELQRKFTYLFFCGTLLLSSKLQGGVQYLKDLRIFNYNTKIITLTTTISTTSIVSSSLSSPFSKKENSFSQENRIEIENKISIGKKIKMNYTKEQILTAIDNGTLRDVPLSEAIAKFDALELSMFGQIELMCFPNEIIFAAEEELKKAEKIFEQKGRTIEKPFGYLLTICNELCKKHDIVPDYRYREKLKFYFKVPKNSIMIVTSENKERYFTQLIENDPNLTEEEKITQKKALALTYEKLKKLQKKKEQKTYTPTFIMNEISIFMDQDYLNNFAKLVGIDEAIKYRNRCIENTATLPVADPENEKEMEAVETIKKIRIKFGHKPDYEYEKYVYKRMKNEPSTPPSPFQHFSKEENMKRWNDYETSKEVKDFIQEIPFGFKMIQDFKNKFIEKLESKKQTDDNQQPEDFKHISHFLENIFGEFDQNCPNSKENNSIEEVIENIKIDKSQSNLFDL